MVPSNKNEIISKTFYVIFLWKKMFVLWLNTKIGTGCNSQWNINNIIGKKMYTYKTILYSIIITIYYIMIYWYALYIISNMIDMSTEFTCRVLFTYKYVCH